MNLSFFSYLTLLLICAFPLQCHSWINNLPSQCHSVQRRSFALFASEAEKPEWQDVWRGGMSKVYSAAFVAKDWIKSMPCAVGLKDCDTPKKLELPGPSEGSGVENVDVMSFLNLKRAKSLKKSKE